MEINVYEDKIVVDKYALSRTIPKYIFAEYIEKILQETNPRRICDFGFGTGAALLPIANYAKETEVLGIDSSKEMYNLVAKKLKDNGLKARLINENINNAKKMIGTIDVGHIKAVTHIPNSPEGLLKQISKIITTDGHLVIGKEYSQPEDNLEQILKYGQNGEAIDNNLHSFYEEYFVQRDKLKLPFKTPHMPAGDYENATKYLTNNCGFNIQREIQTITWGKTITFSELIEAIKIGTFSVFGKNVSEKIRNELGNHMKEFCRKKGHNVDEDRVYDAQLRAIILKK